jgi:hypothetical protein
MTQDQILAALRHVATLAGGYAVGRGWMTGDQMLAVLGLLPGLVAAWFAFRSASPAAQIEKVASNPDVSKIVATNAVANASSNTKVVTK